MAPMLSMKPHWFAHHTAYTMAKHGMSMCTLGRAAEFARHGIGVNSLWPRTAIATAALQMIPGVDPNKCRRPDILADAAHLMLIHDAKATTGNFIIDDTLLAQHGVTDLDRYPVLLGATDLIPDFVVDWALATSSAQRCEGEAPKAGGLPAGFDRPTLRQIGPAVHGPCGNAGRGTGSSLEWVP